MGVKVMTDSTSYIDKKIRKNLDISMVSLSVSFADESIREIDIGNEDFYKKMGEKGVPVSSQPSIGELYEMMKKILSDGHDLLGVFLSSDMSGTYNSACSVAEKISKEFPDRKIHILDSKSNSMEEGFAAIVAARAAKEGKDFETVRDLAEKNIDRSRFIFIPDNLEYLKKGGRIGGAGALLGNILKIIPILTVKDGKTAIFKTVRSKVKATKLMVDKVLEDNLKHTIQEIIVHHINCYDEAYLLAGKLSKELNKEIDIVSIGPVIGLHVGPGSIGIAYYTEDELEG